jgi:adenine phosphoribosyltransferase
MPRTDLSMDHLKRLIRDIPDFPLQGVLFRDVTPLLRDRSGLAQVVDAFAERYAGAGIDVVAGIESRGFVFGAPLAMRLGAGFVPVRKPGKLPAATIRREYALEYGINALELHTDAVRSGERVLLVDDLLATGGTACAAASLVEELGGVIAELAFVVELEFLGGRGTLGDRVVHSLVRY